jgi:AraC-like DNA-binding protein
MARRQTPQAVEWLLRQGGVEQPVPASQRMAFQDEFWSALIERVDIGEGLRIYLTTAAIRRGLSLVPMQMVPGAWLCSKAAAQGRVTVSLTDGAATQLSPSRSLLFRPRDGTARFSPTPRQTLRLAGYTMRADRVASLCDGDVPAAIAPLLEEEMAEGILLEIPATAQLQRIATRMFSEQFTGGLRAAYLEGLALQLFALQSAAVAGAARARPDRLFSRAEQAAIRAARERLFTDIANPPTAAVLAEAVGMAEKRLNAGFKALYGTSVFETLRNGRLEHARIVLEHEDVPIKDVAHRVGYNHVTNFISAFTARYGAPPRQYAKNAGADSRSRGTGRRREHVPAAR